MDLAINTLTNDIYLSGNDLATVKDQTDCVVQLLAQRLQFFYGEWFIDQSLGIPYIQQIFTKNPSPVVIDSALKLALLNTAGIVELTAFAVSIDTSQRQLQVTGTVRCVGSSELIDFNTSIGL